MSGNKGFTLAELIIVISLITIISGAFFTGTRVHRHRVLQNASLSIQADIRRVQRLAVIEGRRLRILVDANGERYFIRDGPTTLEEIHLPPGIVIARLSHGRWHMEFLPRGTIDSGFTLYLESGNLEQHMTVTPVSGRVSICRIGCRVRH